MKPITLEEAKQLKLGTTLYHVAFVNKDGSPQRWRVNGIPKIWKKNPSKVLVPIKNGLRNFSYLSEHVLNNFSLNIN